MPFLPNKKLMTIMKFSRLHCILCWFNILYIKIKSRNSKVYAFYHKKKSHSYLMAHSIANVLYLSICMLGNCACFYFLLPTFFKNKHLQINHPVPPSECWTVRIQIKTDILLVFIWVQTVCKILADDKNIRWHAKSYNR